MLILLIFIFLSFFLFSRLNDILGLHVGYRSQQNTADETLFNDDISHMSEIDKKILEFNRENRSMAFDKSTFLAKARRAFEVIFDAYANGDTATLKNLLVPRMYKAFCLAIDDRKSKQETLYGRIERVINVELTDLYTTGSDVFAKVNFVTDQLNYITNSNGDVIDGNKEFLDTSREIWTFTKKFSSRDQTWLLQEITQVEG